MLVYSRTFLLSLRKFWKVSSSAQSHGSVNRPIQKDTWDKLISLDLLAQRRGQRGGNHLRNARPISRVYNMARDFKRPNISSTGPVRSNLLNIQFVTSVPDKRPSTTIEPSKSSKFLKSKLHIAHLNIRSVKERNHLIQLRELAGEKNYDVIAISESWLNSTTKSAEVEIAGYKLTRLDRLKKKGGGVCIYTRSSLKIKRLNEISITSENGFQQ